jgi:hypothetical protein
LRPTTSDLADAIEDLEALAYAHDPNGSPRNNSGFRDLARLLNLFAWVDGEIHAAERAAAFGPGVKDGYHTLQRSGEPTDLDARTRDAHAKALRNLRSGWNVELGRVVDAMRQDAMDVGRYPTRTEQAV